MQNRTISAALTCTQGQRSKKAHKILISQIALKLPQLRTTLFFGLELVLVMIRVGAK